MTSVIIVNYNRSEDLVCTVKSVSSQSSVYHDIIVIDNGSSDDSVVRIKSMFPSVSLLELHENMGPVARNRGFEIATGDILVCLDNDVYFMSDEELERIAEAFEKHPTVGCITFRIFAANGKVPDLTNWCHPRECSHFFDRSFMTDYISEGACAFRKSVLDKVGYYYEPYFMGHEGDDLAVRLIDEGYDILYTPEVNVCHNHSGSERPSWRTYYYHTRNSVWFYYRNFRLWVAFRYILWYLLVHFCFAAKNRQLPAYFRGLRDALGGMGRIKSVRRPISKTAEQRIKELRRYKPSIVKRIVKHLKNDLFQDVSTSG